jgi:hypothetical protein
MVVILANVLRIQLLKYHDNDDHVIHIQQLTKVCATNGENIDDHKLKYFPNSLRGKTTNWLAKYEIVHLAATWGEVSRAFISQFCEICSEGQAVATLKYAKQNKI